MMSKSVGRVDYLVINKDELKDKITARLNIGKDLVNRKMASSVEMDACWQEFITWDLYNLEMIRQAFELPNNIYAEEYVRFSSSGGIYISGMYKKRTLAQSIENTRGEMNSQVRKLERLLDKVELLKLKPGLDIGNSAVIAGLDKLLSLLSRFHKVVQEFRYRRSGREPIIIRDEYDIQYIIGALLKLHFEDVRAEEFSPSNAGANSRLDFVLKDEQLILEVKMTNEHLKANALGEQLLIDIARYKAYPNCHQLVIFIYDRDDYILNKRGFVVDLEKMTTEAMKIKVVIVPD